MGQRQPPEMQAQELWRTQAGEATPPEKALARDRGGDPEKKKRGREL